MEPIRKVEADTRQLKGGADFTSTRLSQAYEHLGNEMSKKLSQTSSDHHVQTTTRRLDTDKGLQFTSSRGPILEPNPWTTGKHQGASATKIER